MDIAGKDNKLIIVNDPPDQSSPKHILNILNNDCIKEIFRRLENIEDFLTVAEVCTKFQENAREYFPPIYKVFYSTQQKRVDFRTNLMLPSNRVQRFLSIFGDLIEKIVWGHDAEMLHQPHYKKWKLVDRRARLILAFEEDRQYDANDLRILADACGKTVKKLEIKHRLIDFNIMHKFEALENLLIDNCNIKYDVKAHKLGLFSKLINLQIIELVGCNEEGMLWLQQTFPKLTRAWFVDFTCGYLDDDTAIKFIKSNKQLQHLSMLNSTVPRTYFWEAFDADTPSLDLRYLCINSVFHGIHIGEVKKFSRCFSYLEYIHVGIWEPKNANAFINFLAVNDVPIKVLSVECMAGPVDCADVIQKLERIKTLDIYSPITQSGFLKLLNISKLKILAISLVDLIETDIIEALKYAEHLSELRICIMNGGTIDYNFFLELLNLTKNRVKLLLSSYYTKFTILFGNSVLEKNEEWLKIYKKN